MAFVCQSAKEQNDEELRVLDDAEVLELSRSGVRQNSSVFASLESRDATDIPTENAPLKGGGAYIGHVQARTWIDQVAYFHGPFD